MLDCHFDEMWNEFLTDLAGGDLFPPNPYPRLLSLMRQCAMKYVTIHLSTLNLQRKGLLQKIKPEQLQPLKSGIIRILDNTSWLKSVWT